MRRHTFRGKVLADYCLEERLELLGLQRLSSLLKTGAYTIYSACQRSLKVVFSPRQGEA